MPFQLFCFRLFRCQQQQQARMDCMEKRRKRGWHESAIDSFQFLEQEEKPQPASEISSSPFKVLFECPESERKACLQDKCHKSSSCKREIRQLGLSFDRLVSFPGAQQRQDQVQDFCAALCQQDRLRKQRKVVSTLYNQNKSQIGLRSTPDQVVVPLLFMNILHQFENAYSFHIRCP